MSPDIGKFKFKSWTQGGYTYKEASGELNVPGKVRTHRNVSAQRAISKGTGEHAGHLIGTQFGAPGDACNLALQNPNMNTFAPKSLQAAFRGVGGSYHNLESHWSARLRQGYRITVIVRDKYRLNQNRPFSRWVEWTEISPAGVPEPPRTLDFGNFSSPQSRAANH